MERRSLSDILSNGSGNSIRDLWRNTEAAGELEVLPAGEYVAHIVSGDLQASRSNSTPGYKLSFKICEGPHAGRRFWHDLWFTGPAMPQTKRDLQKLGVTDLGQLERPLPRGIRCLCKLVVRTDDDGNTHNRVRSFTVVGIDATEADTFAPANEPAVEVPEKRTEAEAGNANAAAPF